MKRNAIAVVVGVSLSAWACTADRLDVGSSDVDSGTNDPTGAGGTTFSGGAVANGNGGQGGTVAAKWICGNGVLDPDEMCDDGNTVGFDGCTRLCQIEYGYHCDVAGAPCLRIVSVCGDGVLSWNEGCDDANTVAGDGCSANCEVEKGWSCQVPGQACRPLCGDSLVMAGESCDDGNTVGGDGCSSTCRIEPGAACSTPGKPCLRSECGNGKIEAGEACDLGDRNGLFYGDGKECSKFCTLEPVCLDGNGHTQACTTSCGDGKIDPGEDCDDSNPFDGDGCSRTCKLEAGYTCATTGIEDTVPCSAGVGQCLRLAVTYRDFLPENAVGGHPDFPFLGTRYGGSKSPTTICVPNAAGPVKGNDSTARCWGIADATLLHGKPQPGPTTTCQCSFSEWSVANASRIATGYTAAGNDSPLSDGNGGYLGGSAGASINTVSTAGAYTGALVGFTASSPGGPVFVGTVPAYKDAASFNQWFNDDATVNKTIASVLDLRSIGSSIYQYTSTAHLAQGGFFPLDGLNPAQATLCNLFPYWNHGNGEPIWPTCIGDQYFFPPRLVQSDCPTQNPLTSGCWVSAVEGVKHDSYFTDEVHYYFQYDGSTGVQLGFYADDDLFVFINGVLVVDLGGIHQQLPGKVTVVGNPGDAQVTEGGCLDVAGNITGLTAGSHACSASSSGPGAAAPDDFRVRSVKLGLQSGKVYEVAIFGADRHPPESNYQITLSGSSSRRSMCSPRCGDGIVTAGEECDDGGQNSDSTYGGCTTQCLLGAHCGDGIVNVPQEECDLGSGNGIRDSANGCMQNCRRFHYCGDGIVDADSGEECDLGANNGLAGQPCSLTCKILS